MKRDKARRQVLQGLMALPFVAALVADARRASAQTGVAVPVKVDTKGLVAKIKFEAELAGFLTELNGRMAVDRETAEDVARDFLVEQGLLEE